MFWLGEQQSESTVVVFDKSICPFCSACTFEMLWMNRKGFPNATNSLSADIECRLYVGHQESVLYFMYVIDVKFLKKVKLSDIC